MRQSQKRKGMVIRMSRLTKVLGFLMILIMGFPSMLYAAEADKTVTLTEENAIVYDNGNANIGNAFLGMAPGDTRTLTIRVQNNSEHEASFFISQETIHYLEENEQASGGAYTYCLSVGKENDETALTLLSSVAGGYDASLLADAEGLSDITELKDYQYFAKLDSGEYTNVYLTLAIDGEGFDSTDTVNYENANGELEFNFRAYYEDREPTVITEPKVIKEDNQVITEVIDNVVRVVSVKTGDPISVVGLLVILMAGITLIVLALRKRKEERQS